MSSVVWITGASQGLGRALALELASRGNTVIASARSDDELQKLEGEAGQHGGTIKGYPLDITDEDAVKTVVDRIENEVGEIEIAVLNAGTHQPADPKEFSAAGMTKLFSLNVLGTAKCIEAILPKFIERNRGRLAIVASVAGYCGLPTAAYYGASKAALINLAETLRLDLAKTDIIVQCVNPGFVKTPLTDKNEFDMPFLMEAVDAAKRFADGLESDRFEVAFPRPFIFIMKILRALPYRVFFTLVGRKTKTGQ